MPRPEGVNPEHHNQEQGRTAARERQWRGGDSSTYPAEIHEKVVDAPRNSRTLVDKRIFTTLEQMGGHHQLLGGTETTQREEIRRFVIAPEDISQGYFANQQRIAREQGRGELEITSELRSESTRVIRGDQAASLSNWVTYLNDPTTTYPQEFKYFVLRNVLSLGVYDKENLTYRKRSKGTTATYPELSREALALVYDQYATGNPISEGEEDELPEEEKTAPQVLNPDERFLHILKPADFGKDYARALELTRPKEQDLSNLDGEWLTFAQTEDPEKVQELADFLQGKGTDWCTAGVATAKKHLAGGDFHVYASYDDEGNLTKPRIAIRMEEGEVAELRGIKERQSLEPKLIETAEKQLQMLPGGENFHQKVVDMKLLTAIEKKSNEEKQLTVDELRFLYEIDRKIQGFGYYADPRVKEIIDRRDKRADGSVIFDCHPEQIAFTPSEVTDETRALFDDFAGVNRTKMPEQLSYIRGNADLKNSEIQDLGNVTNIGGDADFGNSQVRELGNLTTIGGYACFENSQIQALGNLTTIEGIATFSNSQVQTLGNLTSIGGSAYFDNSEIQDLGNLSRIGERADFQNSQVQKLKNLTFIGGELIITSSQIHSLGKLIHIGRNLHCQKIDARMDTDKLNEILQGEIIIER